MEPIWVIVLGILAYIVVLGGAGIYVSAQKNRTPAEGIFLGIFLGPWGVIAAACLPTLPAREKAEIAEEEIEDLEERIKQAVARR
jgi:hypothetical protein